MPDDTERVCPTCAGTYTPSHPKQQWCSRRCGQTGRPKPARACEWCGEGFTARSGRAKFCETCSPRDGKGRRRIVCAWCNQRAVIHRQNDDSHKGLYCSRRCGSLASWDGRKLSDEERRRRDQEQRRRDRKRRAERRVAQRYRLFVVGKCPCCEQWFTWTTTSDAGPSLARYCSDACRRRHRGKGRNRPPISPAQRRAVFERDGWVCQICKRRVAKTKRWPHPRSPVVDHVIPLAAGPDRGGVHAPHNWQTAHAECNTRKADDCAQLALFGVA